MLNLSSGATNNSNIIIGNRFWIDLGDSGYKIDNYTKTETRAPMRMFQVKVFGRQQ